MCGIAGGVAVAPGGRPRPEIVSRMCDAIRHRGPDGSGLWTSPSGSACFGHRRLSVIDLELGQQPFVARDESSGLVFNGEIYNYLELRKDLERGGSCFTTHSDTEVLHELLRVSGVEGISRTVGMFAFAFWDERTRTLLLARDRVGKKPLYYAIRDRCLYFCSTLRGLEAALPTRPALSSAAVANFLDVGYVPAPETIYQDVWKLSAATYVQATQGAGGVVATRFWTPEPAPGTEPVPVREASKRLEETLKDAVRLRLRSDVPLGVFLSGGIDSSLVTALARDMSEGPVKTFTIGFDIGAFDESSRARRVAAHLGTEHREFRLESDLLELLPQAIDHFGEPFADSAALPLWYLAREAREEVTVALMGDGGDEGFGGYDWYRTALKLDAGARLLSVPGLGSAVRAAALPWGRRARRLAWLLNTTPASRFADLRCMFGPHGAGEVLDPELLSSVDPSVLVRQRIVSHYRRSTLRPSLRMQYADLRTYLADGLLPKVDVSTMAHGLEARAPLLDHRVLELAYRLPSRLNDPRDPKKLLRQILGRYVPEELTAGPKRGFTVPLRDWFRSDLRENIESLSSGPLSRAGYVRPAAVRDMVDAHLQGRRDNSERLFHLLVLDLWLQR